MKRAIVIALAAIALAVVLLQAGLNVLRCQDALERRRAAEARAGGDYRLDRAGPLAQRDVDAYCRVIPWR